MSLSIITPILDSHELVRRQILHYENIVLPKNVELIFVDDGSNPPLSDTSKNLTNFRILRTNDKRPWTEHIARNMGVRESKGEYVLLIDIDYIIPKSTVEAALEFKGDRMHFKRWFGVIDENGCLDRSPEALKRYGLKDRWIRKAWVTGHRSQMLIRKDLFWKLGGYNEALDGVWRKTGGAGERFWRKWQKAEERGEVTLSNQKPIVFFIPSGKYCNQDKIQDSVRFHNLQHGC